MLPAGLLIIVHSIEGFLAAVAVVELLERLIVPVHHDLFGPGAIALLHHQLHELRLIQSGVDKDLLALLNVDAGPGDQLCVFAQNSLFHGILLLNMMHSRLL